MTPVIDAHGLVKRYGRFTALDGLDLTVHAGETVGFLGPNGAGKSTTIRVLLGLLRYDGGSVTVFGADPHRDAVAVHRRLAYVPGDVTLWPNLTGGECIDLLLSARGVADPAATRRDELVERFDLDPRKKSDAYSKGNRQKVAIIAALAAPADLLILDEPTSGLDPLMNRAFIDSVREHAEQGAAVLMSSHSLADVEQLCSTVTIVKAGRTVRSGSLSDLRHLRRSRVTATVPSDAAPTLERLAGIHDLTVEDAGGADEVSFTVEAEHLGELTAALAAVSPTALSIEPPSLEELFLHTYSDAS
ncbi:MAG: ABC transporter ATP-binding protein [Gordonia sp. (in: high G+C Gram-positive bacteria)]|uniref:ABC transporter ATP-binding protein n=1 Tax=Gordonia sp. (in: high G+C Gram-positive bacteria) TaxID=84139 RepID=UPI0039E71A0B